MTGARLAADQRIEQESVTEKVGPVDQPLIQPIERIVGKGDDKLGEKGEQHQDDHPFDQADRAAGQRVERADHRHPVELPQRPDYETEDDNLEAGRITYFLKLVTAIVLLVGAVISLLSFYMLMLSVYLLLQKNTTKLENLLLIGYRPALVALPYQLLTAGLNFVVLLLACVALCAVRGQYMQVLSRLFPQMESPSLLGTIGVGAAIFLAVSLINCLAIRRKINSIRLHRD